MNEDRDFADVPFVNEECGDTMWDEATLNQLANPGEQRPPLPPSTVETATQNVRPAEDTRTTENSGRV